MPSGIMLVISMVASAASPVPGPAAAPVVWGRLAHRVVARIAERHLSDASRAQVQALLAGGSLADASTWADAYRSTPAGRHTAAWHYVNVPDGEVYVAPGGEGPTDIIGALALQERVLADAARPAEERVSALKFLLHFVADLHNPLHAGRASDRGGNEVTVKWFGHTTDLHSVWDTRLPERREWTEAMWVEALDVTDSATVAILQHSEYGTWLAESQDLRGTVYAMIDGVEGVPELGDGYVMMAMPVVERRLREAGIRVAGLLNRLLGEVEGGSQ